MTDLRQTDPRLNIYFQNERIRRFLIKAGLINRHGDILPPISNERTSAPRARRRQTRRKSSTIIDNDVVEEEQGRRTTSVKRARVEKNKKSKQPHQTASRSLSNLPHSTSPTTKKRSPIRAKSARHPSPDPKKHFVRSSTEAKPPIKDRCRVIMIYYGPQTNIVYDNSWLQPNGDEISVLQQHCGGENLIVFRGHVKPNETFAFDSRRHSDYPFALALYINGLIDTRISVCCEYKHKRNVPLGGKHGLFGISDVQKVKPCRSCRYKLRKKKSKSTATITLEPSRYQKSVVPRFSSRNRSHSPVPQRTPSPPRVPLTTKRRSPNISRTPTPPPEEDEKKPPILSANRILPVVSTGRNSSTQSPTASQNDDNENYLSDFEETNDDNLPVSTTRFGRPRISDSHSIGNQGGSTNPSRAASSTSKKPRSSNDEDNHQLSKILTGKSDTVHHSRKSSSSISRKSGPSEDGDNDHLLEVLAGRNNPVGRLSRSLSNISRKSGPPEDENDHYTPRISTERNNVVDDSRSSLSSTSRKSGPSPRYDVKKELNEENNNNNNNNQFSSLTSSENDIGDERLSSSSKESISTTSSSKKNKDIHHSSEVRRISTNSFEEFFRNKQSSVGEKKKDVHTLSDLWYDTNNKNDPGDNHEINLHSTPKTRSWVKDTSSDQDD